MESGFLKLNLETTTKIVYLLALIVILDNYNGRKKNLYTSG